MHRIPWTPLREAIDANEQRRIGPTSVPETTTTTSTPTPEPRLSGWSEMSPVADPVALSLWVRELLYRTASPSVRNAMEREEAAALLHESESAWKHFNGKSRGWIRKHLDEDLRVRASSGEITPDVWEQVRVNRRAALFLEYVCFKREFRVALWWDSTVTVIGPPNTRIVQLNAATGRMLCTSTGECSVPTTAAWTAQLTSEWVPPMCAPSIGTRTVAQIKDLIEAMSPETFTAGSRTTLWARYLWLQFLKD